MRTKYERQQSLPLAFNTMCKKAGMKKTAIAWRWFDGLYDMDTKHKQALIPIVKQSIENNKALLDRLEKEVSNG